MIEIVQGDDIVSPEIEVLDDFGAVEDLTRVTRATFGIFVRFTDGTRGFIGGDVDAIQLDITSPSDGIVSVFYDGAATVNVRPGEYRAQVRLFFPGDKLKQVQPAIPFICHPQGDGFWRRGNGAG